MVRILFLMSALLMALTSCSSCDQELHVFTWGDYFKTDLIKKFEKKYHCCVILDTFDSNESMYAKLKLGALDYDIIIPSNYFVEVLQKQGMLRPIDLQKIPNAKYMDQEYYRLIPKFEKDYAIPFLVSFSGLGYREDRIPDLNPSWSVFANSDYKGRMTMLNDIREALGAALKFLGYSLNTTDEKQIDEAADVLIEWKKNLAKFESELFKNGIASAEYLVVQGYSSDILQVRQEDKNVQFLIPDEGTSISIDCMAIPQKAKNSEMAHHFINFFLEPENGAENMAYIMALSPNTGAYELLNPELRENTILFPPKSIFDKSEVINDLGFSLELYFRAWDKVKAAK